MRALPGRYNPSTTQSSRHNGVVASQVAGEKIAAENPMSTPVRSAPTVRVDRSKTSSVADAGRTASGLGAFMGGVRKLACLGVLAVGLAACGSGYVPGDQPRAVRAVQSVPVTLAPSSMSAQGKYEFYANLVRAMGGSVGRGPTVLGLRGIDFNTRTIHETHANSRMTDTIVVLNGGVATEFVGSTYQGVKDSGEVKPPGMIRESGKYTSVSNGIYKGKPSYWILDSNGHDGLTGVRDHNRDGTFQDEEWLRAAQLFDEVLLHVGRSADALEPYDVTDTEYVSSIACWNVAWDDYDRLVAALGGPYAEPNFVLINAAHAEPKR